MGLCRVSGTGFQAYIHADLIDKFVGWLNENNPEMAERSNDTSWEAMTLDADAQLKFRESDNLCALFIGRTKVGYVKGSENQAFLNNQLSQVYGSKSWQFGFNNL